MEKKIFIALVLLVLIYPFAVSAQTDFPIITIPPPKTLQRNQLQLIEGSTNSNQLTNTDNSSSSGEILFNQLNGLYERLFKIGKRIFARLEKIRTTQPGSVGTKNKKQISKLYAQYNNLEKLLAQTKKDLQNTEELFQTFENGKDMINEYSIFHKQLVNNLTTIREIFNSENVLIGDIRQFASVSADTKDKAFK